MQKIIESNFAPSKRSAQLARPGSDHWSILGANAREWMAGALFMSDMLCLFIAFFAALRLRDIAGVALDPYYQEIFLLLAATVGLAFLRKGLYPAMGMNYIYELKEIVSSASFAFLIVIGVTFVLKTTSIYSRLALVMIWLLTLILIPLGRYLTRRLLIRVHRWGEPVAIIGGLKKDGGIGEYFRINLHLGLMPVVTLQDDCLARGNGVSNHRACLETIKETARKMSLSTALVVVKDLNRLDMVVDRYRFVFERVILIKERNGSYSLHSLKSMDFEDILGLQIRNSLLNPWAQNTKRAVDLLVSGFGLLVLSPLFALTALLIVIDSPGRVFYRQRRLGRSAREFNLLKFRTMQMNAARVLAQALAADPELKKEWDEYQKLRVDPRVTPVGKFLRKFSLDEFPQLWNVLRGDMSLVGPRPMMPDQRGLYGNAFLEYIQVSPGMTGLWQVSGRNHCTFARRAELDREYIERWSVWLDIFTLLKTAKIVFFQGGAY